MADATTPNARLRGPAGLGPPVAESHSATARVELPTS